MPIGRTGSALASDCVSALTYIVRMPAAIVNRQSVAAVVAAVFLAAVAASAAGLVLHRPIVLAFNFSHLCRTLGS